MNSDTGHDDDRSAFGDIARDLSQRFAEFVERMGELGALAGASGSAVVAQWRALLESGATMTSVPLRQLRLMSDAIRAQRDQAHLMREQLALFEDQLTALDEGLRPLLEWAEQWQKAQQSMLGRLGQGKDR